LAEKDRKENKIRLNKLEENNNKRFDKIEENNNKRFDKLESEIKELTTLKNYFVVGISLAALFGITKLSDFPLFSSILKLFS
jgi:F0F1-type ATP synthase assembly protein I